ncbi:hypothetical protein [Photobacterium sp. 1_MG-2023]|nr:hypothetical protein [Photobacterium sp. 1_MG-2023]MDO6706064.1 hypothetical protein [Photobacterium sp. 1_MG-2023]
MRVEETGRQKSNSGLQHEENKGKRLKKDRQTQMIQTWEKHEMEK